MLLHILENETKIMFAHASRAFLTSSLYSGSWLEAPRAGIARVLNLKRVLDRNEQTRNIIERTRRLMTNWPNFIFFSKLYTKEEES
jgi:hypothetical protein